jgi:hypothetical protein
MVRSALIGDAVTGAAEVDGVESDLTVALRVALIGAEAESANAVNAVGIIDLWNTVTLVVKTARAGPNIIASHAVKFSSAVDGGCIDGPVWTWVADLTGFRVDALSSAAELVGGAPTSTSSAVFGIVIQVSTQVTACYRGTEAGTSAVAANLVGAAGVAA